MSKKHDDAWEKDMERAVRECFERGLRHWRRHSSGLLLPVREPAVLPVTQEDLESLMSEISNDLAGKEKR